MSETPNEPPVAVPAKKPFTPKPLADYPDTAAWMAELDHGRCCLMDGECVDIHCVYCGNGMGGGLGPCSKGCAPR